MINSSAETASELIIVYLRKIDKAVDFDRIYDIVGNLYCEDNRRPSADPVVLLKMVLIQHLYGIKSLRQTVKEAELNVGYRWFLGYTMVQRLLHFATISYAFRHRFTEETIEAIFRWILEEVAKAGYLSPEVVFVDGTHIKANANLKKHIRKKPLKETRNDKDSDDELPPPPKEKEIIESMTDPESGVFHKGEHKKCFAYEAHTVCDK